MKKLLLYVKVVRLRVTRNNNTVILCAYMQKLERNMISTPLQKTESGPYN